MKTSALKALLTCIASATLAAPPAESPFAPSTPGASGQIRLRSEANHKSLADTSHTAGYSLLRSRLAWYATPNPLVEAKIELQDARILGSEPHVGKNIPSSTIGNSKGVDLSQGYGLLKIPVWASDTAKIALGRMRMSLGSGRYLSTLEWSPTARSFDGVAAEVGIHGADLVAFAFQIRDTTNYASPKANGSHAALSGLWGSLPAFGGGVLAVEGGVFYELNRIDSAAVAGAVVPTTASDIVTLDLRVSGKAGMFVYEQEGLLQLGESWSPAQKGDVDHFAWFSASRIGFVQSFGKFNLGIDAMGGDGEPQDGTVTQYLANYWFGHQYFGWMDYFVANPRYGVIDLRVDADIPLGASLNFKPQAHMFLPQVGTDKGESLDPYGQEYDAELVIKTFPKTSIVLGAGVFVPGEGASLLASSGLANPDVEDAPGWFLYLSPVINF